MTEYFEHVEGEIQSIELLRYQPGDVLVVKATSPLAMDRADRIKHYTEAHLPGITVLVVDQTYDFQLYRPTPEGDQTR